MTVSAGTPAPWPKGGPVPDQNFCCRKCGEARRYSKTEVHFRDVTLTPAERRSLYNLKVVRQSTECGHRWFLDNDCEGGKIRFWPSSSQSLLTGARYGVRLFFIDSDWTRELLGFPPGKYSWTLAADLLANLNLWLVDRDAIRTRICGGTRCVPLHHRPELSDQLEL